MNCLFCAKPITAGNKGKKYCNDGCKTAYHNQQKSEENEEIQKIKLALINNRRILQRALGKESEVLVTKRTSSRKDSNSTTTPITSSAGSRATNLSSVTTTVPDHGGWEV